MQKVFEFSDPFAWEDISGDVCCLASGDGFLLSVQSFGVKNALELS